MTGTSNIQRKVVVITGASSGLGEAAARHLSAEGRQSFSGRVASSASRPWRRNSPAAGRKPWPSRPTSLTASR